MPVAAPLDPRLTTAAPEPGVPGNACTDAAGRPTICNEGLLGYIDALRAWGRGMAAQLREIAALQPDAPEGAP